MDNFDLPLRLRHTKHYAVFQDQEGTGYFKSDLQGVYQTARQAFIALKNLRLAAYGGYLYSTDDNADSIYDNGIGMLRTLDGSYIGWGYQFCRPWEHLFTILRVKATFVYHEDQNPDYEDEGAGSLLPDDFTEWQLHCEILFDEVDDERAEQPVFHHVNGAHP